MMALSVQNMNFLAVLNKLGIDIKQFPDKTFDGLFENVPEITSYFFNWFIDNITPNNALNQSEQATYFQLESSQSLPSEEEMNYVLSSCRPGYEELISLDVNYINNNLTQDLENLKKKFEEFSDIFTALESNYTDIIKEQNSIKEEINIRKKQLILQKEKCLEMNSLFGSRIDEVKMFLLKEPNLTLKIDLFNELLAEEANIYNEFKGSKLLDREMFNFTKMDVINKLEDDLACAEISLALSEGFLKTKKTEVKFLTELLQKENSQKALSDYILINNEEGMESKVSEEIRVLETQLFDKKRKASYSEVQAINDQFLSNKIDFNKSYLLKIIDCKNYMKSNGKTNSCLLHILFKYTTCVNNTLNLKKQLFSKLNLYETYFINDVTNLELRNQRFKEVSSNIQQAQHPVMLAIKNTMNINENPENNEESLKSLIKLIQHANDDSNFITYKFRRDLQLSIKGLFDNILCGPTSQLMLAPIELLIKFQECEEHKDSLSQVVKKLASKYVEAKETISKSDRKRLLLWIDFLTNPKALLSKCKLPQS